MDHLLIQIIESFISNLSTSSESDLLRLKSTAAGKIILSIVDGIEKRGDEHSDQSKVEWIRERGGGA